MPSFSGLCVKPSLMYHRPFVVCGGCAVACARSPAHVWAQTYMFSFRKWVVTLLVMHKLCVKSPVYRCQSKSVSSGWDYKILKNDVSENICVRTGWIITRIRNLTKLTLLVLVLLFESFDAPWITENIYTNTVWHSAVSPTSSVVFDAISLEAPTQRRIYDMVLNILSRGAVPIMT